MTKRRTPKKPLPPIPPQLRGRGKRYCRCGKLALTMEDAMRRAESETQATGTARGWYKCKTFLEDPWWHTYTKNKKNGSAKRIAKRRREREAAAALEVARKVYGLEEEE